MNFENKFTDGLECKSYLRSNMSKESDMLKLSKKKEDILYETHRLNKRKLLPEDAKPPIAGYSINVDKEKEEWVKALEAYRNLPEMTSMECLRYHAFLISNLQKNYEDADRICAWRQVHPDWHYHWLCCST